MRLPSWPAIFTRRRLPPVSCHCITYGRNRCLEEAIAFFLRQDYPGEKELVIVNDLPEQQLEFDHPEVRIVNLPARVPTIGEKRNLAVGETRGEVLVSWDDDDGYLPGHIRACVGYLEGHDYARPDKCLVWIEEATIERVAGSFIAQHVFTRAAFDRVGGYEPMNSGQDMNLDNRLRRLCDCHWPRIRPEEITYLFRWANGEYHLSGYGRDREGKRSGYDAIGERVARRIAAGELPTGRVRLRPGFRHDYLAMVRRYLDGLRLPEAGAPGDAVAK